MARNSSGGFWTVTKVIVAVIAFVVLGAGLGVGISYATAGIGAATAPSLSKLRETQQVYTPENRINQYNLFYNEHASYETDLTAVKTAKTQLREFEKEFTPAQITGDATGNLIQEQNQDQGAVTGAETICASAANQYNADSRKVQTGAQFKGIDLSRAVSVTACTTAGGSQK
jgi:hypothetical protein